MVKLALTGVGGRMGREILKALQDQPNCILTAAVCRPNSSLYNIDTGVLIGEQPTNIKITSDILSAITLADIVIDFTNPNASMEIASICKKYKKGFVTGTTGFSEDNVKTLEIFSKFIPILKSPNMSPGVNLLFSLAQKAATALGDQYDIEITEKHHRNKLDSPSGTALKLGEVIAKGKNILLDQHAIYQRHGIEKNSRKKNDIGFSCIRGGDIIGEHTALFAGPGEQIEITHKSSSRIHYAQGAITGAIWLNKKATGLYSMQDVFS